LFFSREIFKKDQAIKDEQIKQLEALNKDLQQRLQGKTNLKKLETECNKLKEEQVKLQNQRSQGADQYHKLCKENKDLQEG
jgi:septal ring factor EnvC (AmiA/AmiB activator)